MSHSNEHVDINNILFLQNICRLTLLNNENLNTFTGFFYNLSLNTFGIITNTKNIPINLLNNNHGVRMIIESYYIDKTNLTPFKYNIQLTMNIIKFHDNFLSNISKNNDININHNLCFIIINRDNNELYELLNIKNMLSIKNIVDVNKIIKNPFLNEVYIFGYDIDNINENNMENNIIPHLKKATLNTISSKLNNPLNHGNMNIAINQSMSGSPIFLKDGDKYYLIGVCSPPQYYNKKCPKRMIINNEILFDYDTNIYQECPSNNTDFVIFLQMKDIENSIIQSNKTNKNSTDNNNDNDSNDNNSNDNDNDNNDNDKKSNNNE